MDYYKLIRKILNHDGRSICKHAVCLDILEEMEKEGYNLDDKLVKNIVDADDEEALKILQ